MTTTDLPSLVDAYAEAKAAEAAAAERAKDLRDQIMERYDESEHETPGPMLGHRYAARVVHSSGWRLDTTRLKKEQPAIYAAFAAPTSSTRLTVIDRAQEQVGGAS